MVMGSLPEETDLVVVGGGVGGYLAAIRASQLGMSVTIVEKEKMGGHCLNYACIPSKTLIHIADLFYDMQHAERFGITASAALDAKKMYDWRVSVSKKLEEGVEFLCKSNGVEIAKAQGTFLSSSELQLTDGTNIEFKKAIIATGSEPVGLKGFEFGDGILDYKGALLLQKIPKSITIIGAGYVSAETATLYAKLGSEVSVVARSGMLSHFDPDAAALVNNRLGELGVKIYAGLTPSERHSGGMTLSDGTRIDSEVIVVATGLRPYTKGLGLENTGVQLDQKGFIKVDSSLRTSDGNILAIGDVAGEPMLAHKAMRQGVIAGEVAAGKNSGFDNVVIPAVIFSDPEIAIAGRMEGEGITVTKFPLSAIGRAVALGKTAGFAKIAYDSGKQIRGIEIVSEDANAMIAEAALAIEMGATLEDIADTIHPHPTFSEVLQEAAEAALGRPMHFFYGRRTGGQ
jgi:dihydrolipoamide dehydrogenase